MLNTLMFNPFVFINSMFVVILWLLVGNYVKQNLFFTNFSFHTTELQFMYTVIFSSMLVVLLVILILNRKIIGYNQNNIIIFLVFSVVLFFLVFSKSILIFFLTYECLLLLTSIIVNVSSQNIRSKMITLYFIFWTQLSSFFLWVAIFLIYSYTKSSILGFSLNLIPNDIFLIIKIALFLSFSIKLPLWPFSFWLIKTHVEANTSFSIFLSGVLVKTALIGFLKFQCFFINGNNSIFIHIIVISILSTTYAMGVQIDFKKLIAYTTVQEMSIIVLFLLYNNFNNINLIFYFVLLHTFTSLILFFLNDIIYIRFKTRKTKLMLGLGYLTPKLNSLIIVIWLLLTSVPLSFKFIFELVMLFKIFTLPNIVILIFIVSIQFVSIIFLSINIITYTFGNGYKTTFDLSKNEFIILVFSIVLLLLLLL